MKKWYRSWLVLGIFSLFLNFGGKIFADRHPLNTGKELLCVWAGGQWMLSGGGNEKINSCKTIRQKINDCREKAQKDCEREYPNDKTCGAHSGLTAICGDFYEASKCESEFRETYGQDYPEVGKTINCAR